MKLKRRKQRGVESPLEDIEDAVNDLGVNLGQRHPDALISKVELPRVYRDEGKYDGAEKMVSDVLQAQSELFGPRNETVGLTLMEIAKVSAGKLHFPEADRLQPRRSTNVHSVS